MRLRAVVVAALAVMTVGLGSCTFLGIDDTSTPTGFCIAQARQSCRAQFQCCTATERVSQFGLAVILVVDAYNSEGECVDEFSKLCAFAGAAADESVKAGRLNFDAGKASECVNATKSAVDECNPEGFLVSDESCAEVTSGNVDDGDECTQSAECAGEGSECVVPQVTDDGDPLRTITGKCEGAGGVGDDCDFDGDCEEQLFCNDDGVCAELGQAGDPCNFDDECAAGFACPDDTCVVLPGLGDACDSFTSPACEPDTFCQDPEFDGNGTCVTAGGPGDNCGDTDECLTSSFCDFNTGLCVADGGIGDECDGSDECTSDFCDFGEEPPVCADPNDTGEPEEVETVFEICDGL